jgi:hypothetical protein
MKKIVKIVAFRGKSGNSGGDGVGDGVLNSNHRGTGRGKTAGDLGERVPRVPRGIPIHNTANSCQHLNFGLSWPG